MADTLPPIIAVITGDATGLLTALGESKAAVEDFGGKATTEAGAAEGALGSLGATGKQASRDVEVGAEDAAGALGGLGSKGAKAGKDVEEGEKAAKEGVQGTDEAAKLANETLTKHNAIANILNNTFGNMIPGMSNLTGSFQKVEGSASQTAGIFGKLGSLAPLLTNPYVIAGVAIAAVGAAIVTFGIKFEQVTNTIAANEGISKTAAAQVTDAFATTAGSVTEDAGAIGTAFADVAAQAKLINGGALSAQQSLDLMKAALDGSEASGQNLDGVTKSLVKTLQAFQLGIGDAAPVMDVLYQASKDAGMQISQFANTLDMARARMGAAAPSMLDMSALLIDLQNHGEAGRAAMMALGTAFNGLINPTAAVSAQQKELGLQFTNTTTGGLLPLKEIIAQVTPLIQGMSPTMAAAELKTLGFGAASTKLAETFQAGPAVFQKYVDSIDKTGTAEQAAQTRTSSVAGSFDKMKASITDTLDVAGQKFLPIVKTIASDGLSALTEAMQINLAAGRLLTDGFRDIVDVGRDLINWVKDATDGFKVLVPGVTAVAKAIDALVGPIEKVVSVGSHVLGWLKDLVPAHHAAAAAADAHGASMKDLGDQAVATAGKQNTYITSLNQLGQQAGVTGQQLLTLMANTNTSAQAVITDLQKQATAAGTTSQSMADMAVSSGTSMADIAKAVSGATTAMQTSWNSSFDVVSSIGSTLDTSGADIKKFYDDSVKQAQSWGTNLTAAIQDGYDPNVISQIMQAGPAKAGPLLQSMVASAGSGMVQEVNSANAALTALGKQAVETARLNAEAVASKSQSMASDLSTAMQIQQQQIAEGVGVSAEAVAEALNLPLSRVRAVAGEYGQALPTAMNANALATQAAAHNAGGAVEQAMLNQLQSTMNAADQLAKAQPNALTQQAAATATAAYNQAFNVAHGITQGKPGVDAASDEVGKSLPKGVDKHQEDAKTSGHDLAKKLQDGVKSVDLTDDGKTHADQHNKAVDSKQPDAQTSGHNLAQKSKDGTREVDLTPEGQTHGDQHNKGVDSKQADARTSGKNLAQATLDAAGRVDGKPAGQNIVKGIIDGVNSKQGELNRSMLAVVKAAENYTIPDVGGYGVGAAIDAGIIAGLQGGGGGVNAAAAQVAQDAVTHAKAAIGAKSPSTMAAEEIGLPFSQGIAVGITNAAGLVTKAAQDVAVAAVAAGTPSPGAVSAAGVASVPTPAAPTPAAGRAAGGTTTIYYSPQYTIQGGADPATVQAWQTLLNAHDQELIRTLQAA